MTLSGTLVALRLCAVAVAQEKPTVPPPESPALPEVEDPLSPYRLRFDTLVERAIGTTSVPSEFDWRRNQVQVAATGSYLVELNNFNSMRGGLLARLPAGGALLEFGASYAAAWDSPSSRQLALTPYRQPGHPARMEIDFALGLPLAEGVVTTAPRFFPALQMVFNGYVGFRYLIYPDGYAHLTAGEVATAIIAPSLSADEIDNLEDVRLKSMQVDPGRYGILVGFGDDFYFKPGVFISPRLMVAIPILAPATQTELYVWADLALAVGVAL